MQFGQWYSVSQQLGIPFVFCYVVAWLNLHFTYHKTSSIGRTNSQNLNVSRVLLQWPLPNPLKPGIKLRMKM